MRLLQLMAGAHHGGAEAFFERLAIALQKAGVEQRVVVRRDSERAGRLRAAGVDTKELAFGGLLDVRTRPALRRIIGDFEPQIVLSWMNRATRFCPKGNFVHVARLGGYYNLKYYKNCKHLIGNTRGIVKYIREQGWPAERAHYLPNFVTVVEAAPLSRKSLGVPDGVPLAVALGRLHPNKGFDVLLNAMAKLPQCHLLLAGEGPQEKALRAQAKQLGLGTRVHFLGWRSDIPALIRSADVFVCSSRHEPLGNVVIEAWAAGVPVVAAASQGPVELIKDTDNGLLVPVDDANRLAEAMKVVNKGPALRKRLIEGGRASYLSEFSEMRVIELYKQFFEKVAG